MSDLKLNFQEFGQGPPVVILHGLLGTLDNWQTIARQLAENFTVFTIDQRNHGKSPHTAVMNYELMAEDLRSFMEDHWIHRAHIIGHSMGGKTAMYFALANPDMVEKLVVVDMGVDESKAGHEHIFKALLSLDPGNLDSRKDADGQLKKLIPELGIRQFLLKNLSRGKAGKLAWKMNLKDIYANYKNILAAVPHEETFDGDVLFIGGGRSDYVNPSDMATINKIFPKASLTTITNSGHWVHAEAPEEFLNITENFLTA